MNRRELLGTLTSNIVGLAATGGLMALAGCGGGGGTGAQSPPPFQPSCTPTGSLPDALLTCRNWITFAPPRPFNPNQGQYPSEAALQSALQQLFNEGWRGLVTYSLDGTLSAVPRIAKQVGFSLVIAGLFWFDEAQLTRERAAALSQRTAIDGFVLGNEGLQFGRYTRPRLEGEIARLKADTSLPVATTEPDGQYRADPTLLQVGDWVFPTIHPWLAGIRSVPQAVQSIQNRIQALQAAAPGRLVVSKESWWPTGGGDPAATEANQIAFFQQLAATGVKFVFGEAYDQFWKTDEGPHGPHWGLHTDRQSPKNIITVLQSLYTDSY